jgi:RHS repeat-associated protein
LNATASDSDGTIARVEFYSGATLLATVTQAPYSYTWNAVAAGTYALSAKVFDELGLSTTSAASNVAVTTPVAAETGQVFYIYSDQINTAREITNSAGTKVWQADPDPFGANLPDENPAGQGQFTYNQRFPGQYFDRETGLHYNYFRDYDPQTGRYVQSDPIGLDGGINTYGYVEGNPVSGTDPLGLQRAPRRGTSGPSPATITEIIAQQQVNSLISQIQMYTPRYDYAIIARSGYRFNQTDVNYLRDILRQKQERFTCPTNGSPPPVNYGQTPGGMSHSPHYSEAAPTRNIPGSVIDHVVENIRPNISPRNQTSVYYDSVNNLTVVTGRDGVVSARKGVPREKF